MVTSNIINANTAGIVRYNGTGTFDAVTTTNHDVLIGAASNGITNVSPGASGTALVSNGVSADPSFQAIPGAGVTVTQHDVLVGGAANSITSVSPSTAGLVLASNGVSADPSFQAVPGVGITVTQHDVLVGGASNAIVSVSPSTAGFVLTSNGVSADPSFQAAPPTGLQTLTDGSANVISPSAGTITFVNGQNVANLSGSGAHITFDVTGTSNHAVQIGNNSGNLTSIGLGATGQALVSGGSSADPAFGVLPVAGGGSGTNTLTGVLTGNGTSAFTASPVTQYGVVVAGSANLLATVSPGTTGLVLASNGVSANPSFQAVPGVGVTVTPFTTLVGAASNSIAGVGPGTSGNVLTSNGAGVNPSYQPVPGVGIVVTQYATLVGGASNSITSISPGTAGFVLTSNGGSANPSYQAFYTGTTFTPGISFGGASVGVTYVNQLGRYQIVGNVFYFTVLVLLSSKGSSTGAAKLTGFPFNTTSFETAVPISQMASITMDAGYTWIYLSTQNMVGGACSLYESGNSGYNALTNANFGNTARIEMSGLFFL
jgi:hypothetical protein